VIAVGLDLSLTATGHCSPHGLCSTIKFPGKGMERLHAARMWAISCAFMDAEHPELVAIEGYSFNSRNSQAHALGELGGVIRLALHDLHVPCIDVPPSSLKLYATGKGNAPKDAVYGAAIRHGSPAVDNNQGDAWWLWCIACHILGYPQVEATAYRAKALVAIKAGR